MDKQDNGREIIKNIFNIDTKTLEAFTSTTVLTNADILAIAKALLDLIRNGKNS